MPLTCRLVVSLLQVGHEWIGGSDMGSSSESMAKISLVPIGAIGAIRSRH